MGNLVLILLAIYLGLSILFGIGGAIYWYKLIKEIKKDQERIDDMTKDIL